MPDLLATAHHLRPGADEHLCHDVLQMCPYSVAGDAERRGDLVGRTTVHDES